MKKNNFKSKKKSKFDTAFVILIALDSLLFFLIIASMGNIAIAVVGGNVTVSTFLTVGAVAPEILSVTLNGGATSLDLNANSTAIALVQVIARDYNGESDIINVTSEFFDIASSSYGGADDNNYHYTNNSCFIDTSYGDSYEINATCRFNIQYYANNATWNATALITDNTSRTDFGSNIITINTLLAVGLPDSINYGIVNQTDVSNEQMVNVTNFGNTLINLSLEGYARTQGDNYSMNCSLGNVQNISIGYEKFNLTSSNTSQLTLTQFESIYLNLTSNRTVKRFNLDYRRNDTAPYLDDTNATYWRIYVPVGVAGSCNGNIIFGAALQPGD